MPVATGTTKDENSFCAGWQEVAEFRTFEAMTVLGQGRKGGLRGISALAWMPVMFSNRRKVRKLTAKQNLP